LPAAGRHRGRILLHSHQTFIRAATGNKMGSKRKILLRKPSDGSLSPCPDRRPLPHRTARTARPRPCRTAQRPAAVGHGPGPAPAGRPPRGPAREAHHHPRGDRAHPVQRGQRGAARRLHPDRDRLMREGPTVLVLAPDDDGEAGRVSARLAERGVACFRLDTAAFPTACTVTAELGPSGWHGTITTPEGTLDLSEVGAVLYRQPSPFGLPAGLNASERRFARVEARFGLGGLLASLPARWVPGTPGRVADAEYKPLQLAAADRKSVV